MTAVAACSASFPGQSDAMDPDQASEVRRTFDSPSASVLDRAVDVLVERGELSAAAASGWTTDGQRTLRDEGRLELTGESVARPADTLRTYVVDAQRRFVGETGGRYYLTVRIVRDAEASTTVGVVATIIATTSGPGPIGGRPLRSDGTLERAFLDALDASLS
jgi:hypothetical protein